MIVKTISYHYKSRETENISRDTETFINEGVIIIEKKYALRTIGNKEIMSIFVSELLIIILVYTGLSFSLNGKN